MLVENKFSLSKQELSDAVEMSELSTLELLEAKLEEEEHALREAVSG